MKKSSLKKKSLRPLRLLLVEADRALQDWYRSNWAGISCESCGKPFDVMHHFFPKSSSARLRFEKDNLIYLCKGCHFRHHNTGDPTIHANIIKKRGMKWFEKLYKIKREYIDLNRMVLEKLINEEYSL